MRRLSLRRISSLSAVLVLLFVSFCSNVAVVDQALATICHKVLGIKDVSHSQNHLGSTHEHRHPGQDEPHRHGDTRQVLVVSDQRSDLKGLGLPVPDVSLPGNLLAGFVFFAGLLLSRRYAALAWLVADRPLEWLTLLFLKPVPARVLISSPNAPPSRRR